MSAPASRILLRLARRRHRPVTVGEVVDAFGAAGWTAPVLVFAAAGMIPSPGVPLGMICGAVLMLLGALALVGAGLPQAVARQPIESTLLRGVARALARPLRRLERRLRPGWPRLAALPRAVGAVVTMAMGFLIWLPIPFGNLLPGLALCLMAVGLMAGDGRAVAAGLALAVLSAAMAVGLADLALRAVTWLAGGAA